MPEKLQPGGQKSVQRKNKNDAPSCYRIHGHLTIITRQAGGTGEIQGRYIRIASGLTMRPKAYAPCFSLSKQSKAGQLKTLHVRDLGI